MIARKEYIMGFACVTVVGLLIASEAFVFARPQLRIGMSVSEIVERLGDSEEVDAAWGNVWACNRWQVHTLPFGKLVNGDDGV